MEIKITPKPATPRAKVRITRESLAPATPTLRLAPVTPTTEPALSALPHDAKSVRKLTHREQAAELATARAIIDHALRGLGIDPADTGIKLEMNTRFSRRLGDALPDRLPMPRGVYNARRYFALSHVHGRLRFAASALWRRATPKKRRNTVLHELGHLLADCEAGRPCKHGAGWKAMMRRLGETPTRCHTVNRDGLRRRGSRGSTPTRTTGATIGTFALHARVSFTHKGATVTGTVTKRNRKTLTIRCDAGRRWRVSPSILSAA